jgi:hypothetical protein
VHTYRAYFTGDVAVAQIIQTERERQVQEYQNLGLVRRIVVWVSPGKINLASIASTEFVNPNNFVSGGPGRTGILGLFENEIQGVIFISPLWIWGEY